MSNKKVNNLTSDFFLSSGLIVAQSVAEVNGSRKHYFGFVTELYIQSSAELFSTVFFLFMQSFRPLVDFRLLPYNFKIINSPLCLVGPAERQKYKIGGKKRCKK